MSYDCDLNLGEDSGRTVFDFDAYHPTEHFGPIVKHASAVRCRQ